jgi:hypothetical protein
MLCEYHSSVDVGFDVAEQGPAMEVEPTCELPHLRGKGTGFGRDGGTDRRDGTDKT